MPSKLLIRAVAQTVVSLALMAVVLFLAADDWGWKQGWAYLGEIGTLSLAITLGLAKTDPDLLRQRLSSPMAKGQKPADLALGIALCILFVAWFALMGVDAQRFMWTTVPVWAQVIGAVLVGLCMGLCWETFSANRFAVAQVRVQTERSQTVITTGPYRYIRHPMYAGAVLFFIGTPLILQSLWGLAGSAALILCLALRTLGEERVLRVDLAGYADYMKATPWRIVPGVW